MQRMSLRKTNKICLGTVIISVQYSSGLFIVSV